MKKFTINKNQKLGQRKIVAPRLEKEEFGKLIQEKLDYFDICNQDLHEWSLQPWDYETSKVLTTKTGVPVLEFVAQHNQGPSTVIYFYWDGNKIRAYLPLQGNWLNVDKKTELYQDLKEDVDYLGKQGIKLQECGIDLSDEDEIFCELKYILRSAGVKLDDSCFPQPDYEMCRKDLESNLEYEVNN